MNKVAPHTLQIIAARAGQAVAQAIMNRFTLQPAAKVTCQNVLAAGELAARLRPLVRALIQEARVEARLHKATANDNSPRTLKIYRHKRDDLALVWRLYRAIMADYRALYDSYLFRLDLTAPRPIPPPANEER